MKRIALAVLLAVPAFLYGSSPSQLVPDGAIDSQVQHKLNTLAYYTVFDDLHFSVEGGKVILSGEVVKPLLKIDAEAAVKEVKGVSGVENRIEVLPLSNFDNSIRVRTARSIFGYGPLYRYGLGARSSIHILVKDGNVTLTGAVSSKMDRDMITARVNTVPGIFSVTNDLVVAP